MGEDNGSVGGGWAGAGGAPARITHAPSIPDELPASGRRFVVGVSGASGAHYACRLIEQLLIGGHEVHLVVSEYGRRLLHDEGNLLRRPISRLDLAMLAPDLASSPHAHVFGERLVIHPNKDVGAAIASGSFLHDGMAVIPCSSTSLGAIASGAGSNLLTRAALVTLKERRPLVVCHREMPLSLIDIENLRTIALAGGILCSPNPGLYLHPRTVGDLIDFVVAKVLDLFRVGHAISGRWDGRAVGGGPSSWEADPRQAGGIGADSGSVGGRDG